MVHNVSFSPSPLHRSDAFGTVPFAFWWRGNVDTRIMEPFVRTLQTKNGYQFRI